MAVLGNYSKILKQRLLRHDEEMWMKLPCAGYNTTAWDKRHCVIKLGCYGCSIVWYGNVMAVQLFMEIFGN